VPKNLPTILLASRSPRRSAILDRMRVPYRVVRSTYRERKILSCSPEQLTVRHAVGKAKKARVGSVGRFVMGADTIVWLQGQPIGKPHSLREARRTLTRLSGRIHTVYTGIAMWDRKMQAIHTGVARTKVKIKSLSRQEISDYFNVVNPFDKAGAYAIQHGPKIVERIEGSYSNVMGLPRGLLRKMLRRIKSQLSTKKG
jgi:septum formation protein